MIKNNLNEVFNGIVNSSVKNFKLLTISTFNVKQILWIYLDYTWRKWKQRAPKWIKNYLGKLNLFVNLVKRYEFIWSNIIYIYEALVCPQNITLYSC